MRKIIKKNIGLLILTVIFSLITSIAMTGLSLFLQTTIDYVVLGDLENFKKVIIITFGYALLIGVLSFIYSILSKIFIKRVIIMFRKKIFKGILKKSYRDFKEKNSGDYISILTNDIKLVEENYIFPLLEILQSLFMFIATLGLLLWISPKVTIAIIVSMILMFIVPSIFGSILEKRQTTLSKELTLFTNKIKDIFLGYEVIKGYGLERDIEKEFSSSNIKLAKIKFNSDKVIVLNESLSQITGVIAQFVALFLTAYLVLMGELSMGMLIAVVQLSSTFVQPIAVILGNIPKIQGMEGILKKLEEISNYKDTAFTGTKRVTFNKNITLKNLSFGYGEKNVIDSLNLNLEKGKKYAIVGESGCGKSTLIKLLLGYYSEYKGEILIDGDEIKCLNIEAVNKLTSVIYQNVYMFDKTLKENIALYKDLSSEKLMAVLKQSGVNKFLNENPEGLNYRVGENGNNLSGGQKQRVAIARALAKDTPILVLDEGTSAIDMQTSYDIEHSLIAINSLTLLTVTHNMNSDILSQYDEIIFMKNGNVVEQGSFQELISLDNNFSKFYNLELAENY